MNVTLRAEATSTASALHLRPWADTDLEQLLEAYRDPALRRWTMLTPGSVDEAATWLELQRSGWETGERLSFAVCAGQSDTAEGRLVGHVVLKRAGAGQESAEVGYWTAAHARGRGVAARALGVLTGWAFDTFAAEGLTRLDLIHQVDNHASCRVAEKAGYGFHQVLPAIPPFPRDGHLHVRRAEAPA